MKCFVVLGALVACCMAAPSTKEAKGWWPDCGKSKYSDAGETFIVGGKESRPNEFPWQVSLRKSNGHVCGANLITPKWVVTAAHCTINSTPSSLILVFGAHDREEGQLSIRPIRVINHEDYSSTSLDDDISLLELPEEITLTEDINTICRPDSNENYAGDTSLASGWGSLVFGGILPRELHFVLMPVMSNFACRTSLPPGAALTPNMVCAGETPNDEKDTCQGDSGGPLAVKEDGVFKLIGLTSWGYGCAAGTPGVYTRVSKYNEWIDAHIQ